MTEDDTRVWNLKAGEPFKEDHLILMKDRQTHRMNAKYSRPFTVIAADAPYIATLDDKGRKLVEMMAASEVGRIGLSRLMTNGRSFAGWPGIEVARPLRGNGANGFTRSRPTPASGSRERALSP